MATQIYRVDLSEKARDFQATATEPGLPMLDRQGSNFEILQQWFGTLIAEPEWRGAELVNFYVNEEEGGRLEDIYVYPCTKKDLEGVLDSQLEEIESRLKRARPETSNEELLLTIARDQYKTLTADLDHSDFDCHFFKYRQPGSPWKIVWCWGYQRTDLQPVPSLICHNPDCNILFVRRPDTKNKCPRCQAVVDHKRRRGVWGNLRRHAVPIALALLLLLLLLGWFGRPKLVVNPGDWKGPPGSRANFSAVEKKWFIFKKDVTTNTMPQSSDTRVVRFDTHGCGASAGVLGNATLTFHYGNYIASVNAKVHPAEPPDSLEIEINPEKNVLAVGSTAKLTVWGQYEDNRAPVDFTAIVNWDNSDDQVVARHGSRVEGVDVGSAKLTASMTGKKDKEVSAKADFTVKQVDFLSLVVDVDPNDIPIGGSGLMTIDALDKDKERWCMLGSSLLRSIPPYIEPFDVARVDGDYVAGQKVGGATLTVTVPKKEADPIIGSCDFSVADGGFLAGLIGPKDVVVQKYEQLTVDIATPSILPFEGASENAQIAEALTGDLAQIVGRSVGETSVTFVQGEETIKIGVKVVEANVTGLRIDPPTISLTVGQPQMVRVLAVTENQTEAGETVISEFDVAPDVVEWRAQPDPAYVGFNRDMMEMTGLQPTPTAENLAVGMEDFGALATVTVGGNPLATGLIEGDFGVYPPVNTAGIGGDIGLGAYGNGARVDGGIRVGGGFAGIPEGALISGVGDVAFGNMSPAQIRDYLSANPLAGGDMISYLGPGGVAGNYGLPMSAAELAARMGAVVTNTQTGGAAGGASVSIRVSRGGDYQIVDSGGQGLSDTVSIPEGGEATLMIPNLPPNSGELFIERKLDGARIPFDLSVSGGGGIPGVLP
jgi:hypothetical protein